MKTAQISAQLAVLGALLTYSQLLRKSPRIEIAAAALAEEVTFAVRVKALKRKRLRKAA
jgi:hypothetical protein